MNSKNKQTNKKNKLKKTIQDKMTSINMSLTKRE